MQGQGVLSSWGLQGPGGKWGSALKLHITVEGHEQPRRGEQASVSGVWGLGGSCRFCTFTGMGREWAGAWHSCELATTRCLGSSPVERHLPPRCPTLVSPWTVVHGRLLCQWDSPRKNTAVGCHFLLQGIFPTQGPGFWHCRQTLYCLSHQLPPLHGHCNDQVAGVELLALCKHGREGCHSHRRGGPSSIPAHSPQAHEPHLTAHQ